MPKFLHDEENNNDNNKNNSSKALSKPQVYPKNSLANNGFFFFKGRKHCKKRNNKRAKMALDRSPDFLRLALANFFFGHFQRRIYKNFFMSVQCKKPPFTYTMFIDRSKFQEQF